MYRKKTGQGPQSKTMCQKGCMLTQAEIEVRITQLVKSLPAMQETLV